MQDGLIAKLSYAVESSSILFIVGRCHSVKLSVDFLLQRLPLCRLMMQVGLSSTVLFVDCYSPYCSCLHHWSTKSDQENGTEYRVSIHDAGRIQFLILRRSLWPIYQEHWILHPSSIIVGHISGASCIAFFIECWSPSVTSFLQNYLFRLSWLIHQVQPGLWSLSTSSMAIVTIALHHEFLCRDKGCSYLCIASNPCFPISHRAKESFDRDCKPNTTCTDRSTGHATYRQRSWMHILRFVWDFKLISLCARMCSDGIFKQRQNAMSEDKQMKFFRFKMLLRLHVHAHICVHACVRAEFLTVLTVSASAIARAPEHVHTDPAVQIAVRPHPFVLSTSASCKKKSTCSPVESMKRFKSVVLQPVSALHSSLPPSDCTSLPDRCSVCIQSTRAHQVGQCALQRLVSDWL